MKYFSLSFKTEKSDYAEFYRDFLKSNSPAYFKRTAFLMLITVLFSLFFVTRDSLVLLIPLFLLPFVDIIMSLVYSWKISMSLYRSAQNRRVAAYDFYADHVEIHYQADELSKGTMQKYMKMSGFTAVKESESNFYFVYMNEKILIVPKRSLDEEKYTMIKNLIENYFSDVYVKM